MICSWREERRVTTPESFFPLSGRCASYGHNGDQQVAASLPAHVDPSRVALVGLHDWEDDAYAHFAEWGLATFAPNDLRISSDSLLGWPASTGASKVAIHLDVDSNEAALGFGQVPGGLNMERVRRVVNEVASAVDVVGMTFAEFIPQDVLLLQELVGGLLLVGTGE